VKLSNLINPDHNPSIALAWIKLNTARQILESEKLIGREGELSAALLNCRLQIDAVTEQLTKLIKLVKGAK
jgi:hypothetical protein